MTKASLIKKEIKEKLLALKNAGTLGEVIIDDFKKGLLERDFGAFPTAILTTPSIGGDYFTNTQNLRTYTFEVLIVMKGEDISAENDVEELSETILNAFDNLPTLSGEADGGLEPSSTPAEAVPSRSGTYIVFSIILKAKAVKDIDL